MDENIKKQDSCQSNLTAILLFIGEQYQIRNKKYSICLFVDMVDSLKNHQMKEEKYNLEVEHNLLHQEIYRLRMLENMDISSIREKFCLSRSSIYRALATFEKENPEQAALMKKQGKDVTPEDYKKLQEEIATLKKDLTRERLRADFYEEMVVFGKEVYGIDLKKVGTK